MKTILVDPNLVCNFFANILLILIMVKTLEKNYFLVRTKLGYLRCIKYLKNIRLWVSYVKESLVHSLGIVSIQIPVSIS